MGLVSCWDTCAVAISNVVPNKSMPLAPSSASMQMLEPYIRINTQLLTHECTQ